MNLHLLQLGDSALPIGGYSHSWGLEAAVDKGLVKDAASLERWARLWLSNAVAPLEGVVVSNVCRAVVENDWNTLRRANEILWTSLTPPTLRQASRDMGEQLLSLAENWPWARGVGRWPAIHFDRPAASPTSAWHHAIVFGVLAAAAPCSPRDAIAIYLHQASLGIVSAGVRGIPIGHTHGQEIVARLHDTVNALADDVANRDLETAGSTCPAYEVLCYEQSQLYTRIFRS